jgi:hypothetical protein
MGWLAAEDAPALVLADKAGRSAENRFAPLDDDDELENRPNR